MNPPATRPTRAPRADVPLLPVIPLRDVVVFPGGKVPFIVGRSASIAAVRAATAGNRQVLLAMQLDADVREPSPSDLHAVGTVGRIVHDLRLHDGNCKLLVEGLYRARATETRVLEGHLAAAVTPLEVTVLDSPEHQAARTALVAAFGDLVKVKGSSGLETATSLIHGGDLLRGCDELAGQLTCSSSEKQELLETLDATKLLQTVERLVRVEIDRVGLDEKLHRQVQRQVDQAQREYLLTEKMKAIQKELGRKAGEIDVEALDAAVRDSGMPEEAAERARQEIRRLEAMPALSAEATVSRNYLEWLLAVPWTKRSRERKDLQRAQAILDEDHHGLEKVKERILEFLAVRLLLKGPQKKGAILCFVGPPGVGKTSLGRSMARATGREFARVSLGGVRDEAEVRGHRRTYIGAYPGRIIQMMRKAGTRNPVFLLDEVDKMSMDFRGDPSAALLEVLDPESNSAFMDHYLDTPFDLSEVMFLCTANLLDPIPPALRDRLEVVRLPGYTLGEKIAIGERFLVPRQREAHGLEENHVNLSREALQGLVESYTREAGVRNLDREIANVCRKVATRVVRDPATRVELTGLEDLKALLGSPRFRPDVAERAPQVGVAMGLAWTELGGQVLIVEATRVRGRGKLLVTGRLGDVMQESLQAAVTYVRARSEELGLSEDAFRREDIHVHVPEGATPKDGPSAGITLATAVASALSGRAVRHDVAMTGEITLRGHVLPVGGIKEKLLAAHRVGVRDVILPRENASDLEDVPQDVRAELHVSLVESMDEVLSLALLPARTGAPDLLSVPARRAEPGGAEAPGPHA
jgi:ATP-dependent Lon protease